MSMRTKEFRLILTILLALLGMQAKAEDRVVIQSAEVEAGEEFFLPVELVNDRIYKAFQMDIVLPDGITPALDKRNKPIIEKDGVRMEDTDHSFSTNFVNGTLILVCTSMNAYEFYENSGTLFSVKLKAD